MKNLKIFRKADILAVSAVLLIAVAGFFLAGRSGNPVATVTVNGEEIKCIDLSDDMEKVVIVTETSPVVTIVAENGGIRFEDSGCPDKLCVRSGVLRRSGSVAACLPAGVVIHVDGKKSVDAVTW